MYQNEDIVESAEIKAQSGYGGSVRKRKTKTKKAKEFLFKT